MAGATGLDAQIGYAAESTFGTYVAPSRFIMANSETFNLELPRIEQNTIGSGQKYQRTDAWANGKKQAGGNINGPVSGKGWGLLLQHLFGSVTTTADGTGKKHSFSAGSLLGKSLSIQIGKPSTNNTVNSFSYLGSKLIKGSLKQSVEGWLEADLQFDCTTEDTGQTLGSLTIPSQEWFNWNDLVVQIAGGAFNCKDAEIDWTTPVNQDRFFQGGAVKKEQLENGKRMLTGKLTGEFESMTNYNRFAAGTVTSLLFTWTGTTTYDVGKFYRIVLTIPNVRYDGDTPNVAGPDVLVQNLPWKYLDDASSPMTLDYYTSDATP